MDIDDDGPGWALIIVRPLSIRGGGIRGIAVPLVVTCSLAERAVRGIV